MKKLILPFFPVFVCLLMLSGCFPKQDPCGHECENGGECFDTDCICALGYEGLYCTTTYNAKFNGHFHATQVCNDTTNTLSDTILVAPHPSTVDGVDITGLWELPQSTVIANVKNDGVSFEIARQAISTSHEISAMGMSNAAGTNINLTYYIYPLGDTTIVDSCQATLQR